MARISDDEVEEYEDVKCIAETRDALRLEHADWDRWVPKSVVHDDSEVYALGHKGKLVIKRWFVEKEKWD